jgi:hypothetical protein
MLREFSGLIVSEYQSLFYGGIGAGMCAGDLCNPQVLAGCRSGSCANWQELIFDGLEPFLGGPDSKSAQNRFAPDFALMKVSLPLNPLSLLGPIGWAMYPFTGWPSVHNAVAVVPLKEPGNWRATARILDPWTTGSPVTYSVDSWEAVARETVTGIVIPYTTVDLCRIEGSPSVGQFRPCS